MRLSLLLIMSLLASMTLGQENKTPILHSFDDFKAVDKTQSHSADLRIFADGSVKLTESGSYQKKTTFETKLSALKLQRLTALLNGKGMKAVPAKIGSQIKVLDGQLDKKLDIRRADAQQTIQIENFYPQLNTRRPAYPKALVELECMLQEIERKAAKRPAPSEGEDWCPEIMGKH